MMDLSVGRNATKSNETDQPEQDGFLQQHWPTVWRFLEPVGSWVHV